MRVLNIMMAKGRGGIETMAMHYHMALVALGFSPLSIGHPKGALKGVNGFAPLKSMFQDDPFAALNLRALSRTQHTDLVLTHGNRATGIGLSKLSGCASITVPVVHNFRFKAHLKHARHVICVSQAVEDAVKRAHPHIQTHLLVNFSPLKVHAPKPLVNTTPVIGVLGRLHENKGFDTALHALAILKDQGETFRFIIAGDGPLHHDLKHLSETLGLKDYVTFLGWVDDGADFIKDLDLFLVPSRTEPFGLVIIEAMAAGVPVIASDIDGPRAIITHEHNGLLCPANDPIALANVIKVALSDPAKSYTRSVRAQDNVLDTYDMAIGKKTLFEILNAISTASKA